MVPIGGILVLFTHQNLERPNFFDVDLAKLMSVLQDLDPVGHIPYQEACSFYR